MKHELETLNSQQRAAVERVNGRLLILAGAGSGKTRVLTLRMAYLITQLDVSPKSILGLTFTNKAAAEMRHRLAGLIGNRLAKQVTLCTFHSFCMNLLRQEIGALGYTTNFTLYDEQDVQRLVNLIVRDILQHEGELPSLAPTMKAIRQACHRGNSPQEIQDTGSNWHDEFAQEVYRRLKASMRAYNVVDFDHLLSLTVELFQFHPAILNKYQERYHYLMIDEYQDTNPIQYQLAALLSSKSQNLCVVGDDDQSIYGWRGADVKNILSFEKGVTIKLEQNYRSTNTILKAANAVIKHNSQRHHKSLWSTKGEGDLIEVFYTENEMEEAQSVVQRIMRYKEELGLKWKDMAILYRSNALSRQFELALLKQTWKSGERWIQGIPYQVFGGDEFYQRREVKDICAYLRVIINPLDQEALLRIINQPRRGIGEESLDALTLFNRSNHLSLWEVIEGVLNGNPEYSKIEISKKAREGLSTFVNVIRDARHRFSTEQLSQACQWLIDAIDYRKAIAQEVKSQQMRDFKWENVLEFLNSLKEFACLKEDEDTSTPSLETFISNLTLDQTQAQFNHQQSREDHVVLLTFHSAKGLEFPVCFLVGVEDHIIPHEKSLLDTGLEEERRLMYVAMTRAQQRLVISMSKRRQRMGKETASRPSRFLFEIPESLFQVTQAKIL